MHHTDRNAHNEWADHRSRAPVATPRNDRRYGHPIVAGVILAVTIAAGLPWLLDSLHLAARIIGGL